jgi:oxygen-independent coproporphyrinogen III oxidase
MLNTDFALIKKYNVPGPRYTSYPTTVQFQEIGEAQQIEERLKSNHNRRKNLSLYFHIPFCFSLCWYCGCTKIITKDADRGDHYIDYLEKEMDLVENQLQGDPFVTQIHFGGGTPTFLRPDQLRRLGDAIRKRFTYDKQIEFSVEIDPRRCTREHAEALADIGCNRASLGVQDTNREVQEAIHRIQPFEETEKVTQFLRDSGINQINFDLIYGLPRQTPARFRKTVDDVMKLDPDRLAIYSYAHLPHLMPSQKLLNESEFPSTEEKLGMIQHAIESLPGQGMRFIGMDHFARENDSLSRALDDGTLQRNFQGYSTHAETDMIAFGMSGISQLEDAYYQNTKDLGEYYRMLDENRLPVIKELKLTRDDKIRKALIMQIMCTRNLDFIEFSGKHGIDFEGYFREELQNLDEMEEDGLLIRVDNGIMITDQGRLFLRNIAMTFDAYLKEPGREKRYSKTV